MKLKKLITIGLTAVMAVSAISINAMAYSINRTKGFSPVPASIEYYYDFSSETIQALRRACNEWNTADNDYTFLSMSGAHYNSSTTFPYKNGKNQIIRAKRGTNSYLMKHEMASGISGSVSYEGDIDINVSHPFGTADTSYDTETAFVHELGHLLGLGHSGATYTVMSGKQAKGERNRYLYEDDVNGIQAIYK